MADQLIYLVETRTKDMDGHEPECVTDAGLATKLGEGYEILSTLPSKKVTIGKKVSVTPMILRQAGGQKNAVSLRQQPERRDDFQVMSREEQHGGGMLSTVMNKLSTALAQLADGGSHLGSTRNHSMPGLTIISGEMASKAWDLGMSAARSGQSKSACPFPPLSEAATRWIQGFNTGAKPEKPIDPQALGTIENDAYELALSLDKDDEVTSPYRPGSEQQEAWLAGFKRGGGRVDV